MSERPLPHENLFSAAQFSLNRAIELLPDELSDAQLLRLSTTVAKLMTTLTSVGEAVQVQRERRARP